MKPEIQGTLAEVTSRESGVFPDVVSDVLRAGYTVSFRATGVSMAPSIKEGDKITVEPVAASRVSVGDIVVFRNGHAVTAHRVARITKAATHLQFVPRGDAARGCDTPIGLDHVLGKVVLVERDGRPVALSRQGPSLAHKAVWLLSRLKTWLLVQIVTRWRAGRQGGARRNLGGV